MQTNFKEKVISFHKQIARKQREEIFAKKRQQLYKSQQEYPLQSQCLQKYWPLSAREITLHQDDIFCTLDDINTEELSEEQHTALCSDIIYLLTSPSGFSLPYGFSFRKDGSQYTAVAAAYSMSSLTDEEITYWLTYMNEDAKAYLYLTIIVEEQSYERWLSNSEFIDQLIKDWGYIEYAEDLLFDLMQVADWYDDWEIFEQVRKRFFQMKKNNNIKFSQKFLPIICQLIIASLGTNSYQKKLSSIITIFNESLIQIFNKDNTFDLGDNFIGLVDTMMEYTREDPIILFVKEAFQAMCGLLMENYHAKFLDTSGEKYLKNILPNQNADKVKSKVIEKLINICINYLRINCLYKKYVHIPQNLMVMINTEKQPIHQHSFNKLLNLNSDRLQKSSKGTLPRSHFDPKNYQKHPEIEYQI